MIYLLNAWILQPIKKSLIIDSNNILFALVSSAVLFVATNITNNGNNSNIIII